MKCWPRSILLIFCVILTWSCVGMSYQDQPKRVDPLGVDKANQKVKVLAKAEEWRNTGVVVEKKKEYSIKAKGRWHTGGACNWAGPDGLGVHNVLCWDLVNVVKGWGASALIGKINENGTPFAIGSEMDLTPEETGTLFLRINDGYNLCGDNTGHVDVEIALADSKKQNVADVKPPMSLHQPAIADKSITGKKWAVVVGISSYADTQIPSLRYAAQDAQSFYQWLISPRGGRYAPANVKLLLDAQATGKNVRNALFNWLGQALEEDTVVIFFAGHGSPQSPDQPHNLFLLPSDASYDDVATTGFPMWDIETALKRFIKAKKVVVIADACHSGGVGQSFDIARRSSRSVQINPISTGLQSLSHVGDGVAVISASDDKQLSQESREWGGGHGVFTYYLLKGLNGEADYNKDAQITLGELIPYLSEQVRRETRNAQSPTVSGKFDPALSIAR